MNSNTVNVFRAAVGTTHAVPVLHSKIHNEVMDDLINAFRCLGVIVMD